METETDILNQGNWFSVLDLSIKVTVQFGEGAERVLKTNYVYQNKNAHFIRVSGRNTRQDSNKGKKITLYFSSNNSNLSFLVLIE